jgi:hypothetical protein
MDQQALEAPPAVESGESKEICSDDREPEGEAPRLPPLMPGWCCVPQAVVRAYGEEGLIDLVVLQPERGAALVALLQPGEEASPEEARAAFCAMLADEGFGARFGGELPVVALTVQRAAADEIATEVERAFAAMPRPSLAEAWVDWLAERLAPAPPVAAQPLPRLVAPVRDETMPPKPPDEAPLLAPPRDEALPQPPGDAPLRAPLRQETRADAVEPSGALPAAGREEAVVARVNDGMLAEAAEALPQSVIAEQQPGWLDWGASLGFAVGIVLAMLVGLAVFSHNGRLF